MFVDATVRKQALSLPVDVSNSMISVMLLPELPSVFAKVSLKYAVKSEAVPEPSILIRTEVSSAVSPRLTVEVPVPMPRYCQVDAESVAILDRPVLTIMLEYHIIRVLRSFIKC